MKRRTKVHFGDTYGDLVTTACGARIPRDRARREVAALIDPVTCKGCIRVVLRGAPR